MRPDSMRYGPFVTGLCAAILLALATVAPYPPAGLGVVALLAVVCAAWLIVRSLEWVLPVAAFSLLFDSSAFVLNELPGGLSMPKIIGVLLALALAYDVLLRGARLRVFDDALDYAVAAFLVLVLASGIWGREASVDAIERILRMGFLYFCVKNLLRSNKVLGRAMWAMVLSGAITAAFSIWRFFEARADRIHDIRVGGLYMDPNDYAAAMLVVIVVAAHLALHPARQSRLRRVPGILIGVISVVAAVLTGSRTGLIGLIVVGTVVALRQPRRWMVLATGIVLMALSISFWPASVVDRIVVSVTPRAGSRAAAVAQSSTNRRLSYVDFGVGLIVQRPLAGHGYHAFSNLYASSELVRSSNSLRSIDRDRVAHNTYLEVATGAGLPALAAYLAILWIALGYLRRVRQKASGTRFVAASAFEIGLIGLMVAMLFLSIDAFKMTWFVLGIAAAMRTMRSEDIHPVARAGVCMITARYPPGAGGAEVVVQHLARRLAARQIPVTVVTTRESLGVPAADDGDGVHVVRVFVPPGKIARALGFIVGGLAAIWRERGSFDVLHSHQMFSATTLGLLARGLLRYPLIINPHRGGTLGDVQRLRGKGVVGRIRLELIRAGGSAFVAISREIGRELEAEGIDAARIEPLTNLVDTDRFRPADDATKAKLRSDLGLPVPGEVVIYVGRLDAIKGLESLIDAMTTCDGFLVLVGSGDQRETLETRAARKLPGRVFFAGRRDDVERWFMAADVAVLPSLGEGQPVSLLEAMACGVPVVATDVGGVGEIVVDGETGRVVPIGDTAALASAVQALLMDSGERRRMGRRARQSMVDRFAAPLVVGRYAALYDALRRHDAYPVGS